MVGQATEPLNSAVSNPGHTPTLCHQELQGSWDVLETLLKMIHNFMNSFDTKRLRPANRLRWRVTGNKASPAFRVA